MAGWISASVKLGPGSLGGYFSYIDDKVDDPVEIKSTRNSFGFNYMMPLGKGFMMRPVINFYDNGDPEVDGVSSKGGTLMNAGIQFSLGF